jgi:hypothetical protein
MALDLEASTFASAQDAGEGADCVRPEHHAGAA